MTYREETLTTIAAKIEAKFKRLKPHICEYREFEKNKNEIVEQLKIKRHFTAEEWPDCDKFLLENLKSLNHQEFESVSSESDDEFDCQFSKRSSITSNFRRSRSRSQER